MLRSTHFLIAAAVSLGILTTGPVAAQERTPPGLSISTVGVRAKDYAESLNFYTKVMGLRPAFSFSPNGKTNNTYLQVSRDTFLELQSPAENATPGLSHMHMQTDSVDGVVARLRKAGMPACTATVTTGCVSDARITQPTLEKAATIVDPDGIRIEPAELVPGSLTRKAVDSWDGKQAGTKVLVVGIGVKDYAVSGNFYEKLMGFPIAFQFSSPDGKRTTKYYQVSRDTFLEMQIADGAPGLTHVHILVDDVDATIARLRQAGLPLVARNVTTPNSVTESGLTKPSNVKSAIVFDPSGVRLELNELLPESLTKKAMESWK
ncbi:MAG: VOC family protein [Acidobacteriota bacterium]|nr:VOC family protein [Acidobacteriota bacterium]